MSSDDDAEERCLGDLRPLAPGLRCPRTLPSPLLAMKAARFSVHSCLPPTFGPDSGPTPCPALPWRSSKRSFASPKDANLSENPNAISKCLGASRTTWIYNMMWRPNQAVRRRVSWFQVSSWLPRQSSSTMRCPHHPPQQRPPCRHRAPTTTKTTTAEHKPSTPPL